LIESAKQSESGGFTECMKSDTEGTEQDTEITEAELDGGSDGEGERRTEGAGLRTELDCGEADGDGIEDWLLKIEGWLLGGFSGVACTVGVGGVIGCVGCVVGTLDG